MSRFVFFLLVVANIVFAIHALQSNGYAAETRTQAPNELTPDALKIVEMRTGKDVSTQVEVAKQAQAKLAQGPCILVTGLLPSQIESARTAAAQLGLTSQLVERPLEQIVRYWVYIPKQRDAKATSDAIAFLKKQRVDYSPMSDGEISLGVFASEEAAERLLKSVQAKNVKLAKAGPKSREVKEYEWLLRAPDETSTNKLLTIKRDFNNLQVQTSRCEVFG